MYGRFIHDPEGHKYFQAYGTGKQHINSVSRKLLNEILIQEAEDQGVSIRFGISCTGIDTDSCRVMLEDNTVLTPDYLIGSDGAFSVVRDHLMKSQVFDYEQDFLPYGYKELTIPSDPGGDFALRSDCLHIWPRGGFMLIALPNLDKSFTATLFLSKEGEVSFQKLESDHEIESYFKQEFPDALDHMPGLLREFRENPVGNLVTIKAFPWSSHNNRITLIGDAAHAIVPFYGQGMNAGFEDCRIFIELLKEHHYNWEETTGAFETQRKPDADAIAQLALDNFVEMRDLVADREFILRKKLESRLQAAYPEEWLPLYSMVTFSDLSYSQALNRGLIQKQILKESVLPSQLENWEQLELEPIINKLRKT